MSAETKLPEREDSEKEVLEFSAEDFSRLFHYPSIGQLFSGSSSAEIDEFNARMGLTRDQLESVVRHGTREEAEKAGVVVKGINVTLDFLSSLQEMRSKANT